MATTSLQEPYTPQEIDAVTAAFPAMVSHLMPSLATLQPFRHKVGPWQRFQRDWFFHGLDKVEFDPKPGIDPQRALRHLSAIQASFEPQHEDKEAAVALLAEQWFAGIRYTSRGAEHTVGSFAERASA